MPNQTDGAQRPKLPTQRDEDLKSIEELRASGALVVDERRRRPNYFDGRFLTARDLTREQDYFLMRQADLGRAGGAGVAHGLMVEPVGADGSGLRISAGHGVTASGELVLLGEDLTLALANIPEIERLNAQLGLSRLPETPARIRTGVFLVALRPVEFTANRIAAYPTSITGERRVEDSDIVEAVAVTLIPYGAGGAGLTPLQRQALVAREIFLLNSPAGSPVDALPLAMIYLERGRVEWVDPFLVRREIGADHGDILGLGFAPRAVREAHMLQYSQHLRSVLALRAASRQSLRFAAAEYFQALPPAGELPRAALDADGFTQLYFPAQIDVDLAIIPEDEVIAMVEESYLLPPIDLTADTAALEATSVIVLLPVTRASFRALKTRLAPEALPDAPLVRRLRPAVPGMLGRSRPIEVLTSLRIARRDLPGLPPIGEPSAVDLAWRQSLGEVEQQLLWYTRRRNLAYAAAVTGTPVQLEGPVE